MLGGIVSKIGPTKWIQSLKYLTAEVRWWYKMTTGKDISLAVQMRDADSPVDLTDSPFLQPISLKDMAHGGKIIESVVHGIRWISQFFTLDNDGCFLVECYPPWGRFQSKMRNHWSQLGGCVSERSDLTRAIKQRRGSTVKGHWWP